MNKLVIKKLIFTTSVFFLTLVAFWLGGYIASNQVANSIYATQATLAFSHFRSYKRVSSYLNADCKSQASEMLKFLIDGQKNLMAEYVQFFNDEEFEEYVSLRSPELIESLKNYKINQHNKLVIDDCES